MSYQIKIVRVDPNPEYKEELARFNDKNDHRMGRYNNGDIINFLPKEEIIKDVLIVELSDEQYKTVKKEIIKVFE